MANIEIEKIINFPQEFTNSLKLCSNISIHPPIDRIIIAGMGGSAYPGAICKTYLESHSSFNLPIIIHENYYLKPLLSENSLVFISSYSGNTHEALASYFDAFSKNAKIIVLTSGGDLRKLALKDKIPIVNLSNFRENPCISTGYFVGSILSILENSGLVSGVSSDVNSIENFLNISSAQFKMNAKNIAKSISNKIPIIYTTSRFENSIAKIIKIRLNEVAKIPAFFNSFPGLTHYEPLSFIGRHKEFHFLLIEDPDEKHLISLHTEAFRKVFANENNISISTIQMVGNNILKKIIGTIYLFEWVSIFMAKFQEVDPESVSMSEKLKQYISTGSNLKDKII